MSWRSGRVQGGVGTPWPWYGPACSMSTPMRQPAVPLRSPGPAAPGASGRWAFGPAIGAGCAMAAPGGSGSGGPPADAVGCAMRCCRRSCWPGGWTRSRRSVRGWPGRSGAVGCGRSLPGWACRIRPRGTGVGASVPVLPPWLLGLPPWRWSWRGASRRCRRPRGCRAGGARGAVGWGVGAAGVAAPGVWPLAALVSGGAWLQTTTAPPWAGLGGRRFLPPMP